MISKEILKENLQFLISTNPQIVKDLLSNISKIENDIKLIKEYKDDISLVYKGEYIQNLKELSHKKIQNIKNNLGIIMLGDLKANIPKDLLKIYNNMVSELSLDLISNKEKNINGIESFFFLGTLPFFHIKTIIEDLEKNFPYLENILIYEENLEFIYLFLSIVNLKKLKDKNINVFISTSLDEIKKNLVFLLFTSSTSGYMKSYESPNILALESEIKNLYEKLKVTLPYTHAISRVNFLKNNIKLPNSRYLLKIEEKITKKNKDTPVFIIGSGPSLDKNINILKNLEKKALIFSLTTATRTLIKHGILPDFVTISDSQENMTRFLKDIPFNFLSKIYILSSISVDTNFVKLFKENLVFLYEPFKEILNINSKIKENFQLGFTVLNPTFEFIAKAGFKNIYLLGVDLGTKEEGKIHSKEYSESDKDILHLLNIEAEGNFGGKVLTKKDFYLSKLLLEEQIELFNSQGFKIKVFNLSDGIKINGTIPLHPEDLPIKNKLVKKREIAKNIKIMFKKEKVVIDYKKLHILEKIIIPILKETMDKIDASKNPNEIIRLIKSFLTTLVKNTYFADILINNETLHNLMFFIKLLKFTDNDTQNFIVEHHKSFIIKQLENIESIAIKLLN